MHDVIDELHDLVEKLSQIKRICYYPEPPIVIFTNDKYVLYYTSRTNRFILNNTITLAGRVLNEHISCDKPWIIDHHEEIKLSIEEALLEAM